MGRFCLAATETQIRVDVMMEGAKTTKTILNENLSQNGFNQSFFNKESMQVQHGKMLKKERKKSGM